MYVYMYMYMYFTEYMTHATQDLSDKEVDRLMQVFPSPSNDQQSKLASQLNLPGKTVQAWFRHQRKNDLKRWQGLATDLKYLNHGSSE